MSLESFVRVTRRQAPASQASQASASLAGSLSQPIHHRAASRRLEKGKDRFDASSSPTPTPSREATPVAPQDEYSQQFPEDRRRNLGIKFSINWSKIFVCGDHIPPGRVGYRVKHLSALQSRRQPSKVWDFGADLVYKEEDGQRQQLWLCRACHLSNRRSAAKRVNSYNHIVKHLLKDHRIDVSQGVSPLVSDFPRTPSNPWEAAQAISFISSSKASTASSSSSIAHMTWQEKELQSSLIDWVIVNDISFGTATSAELRGLLSWNRQDLLNALPQSASTISLYIQDTLKRRKEAIRMILSTALSQIALSLDIWTSPNHYSILGVCAHFVDASGKQQDLLIGCKNLLGDHTGEHQGLYTAAIAHEYKIAEKIHCYVADNASNNERKFLQTLNDELGTDLSMDNRIRCAGHIIAIVVKAIIYGEGVSRFEEELANAAPKDQFQLYRRHGVIGKLHNFVNAVCSSHKLRELFMTTQAELQDENPLWTFGTLNLVQDGGIRWDSIYFMLLRCYELRESISRSIRKWKTLYDDDDNSGYNPLTDELSNEEWVEVDELKNFLERFHRATLKLEGKASVSQYGALWQTILHLQLLDEHLRKAREAVKGYDSTSYIKSSINYGIELLTTYWAKLVIDPEVSYYCVALALCPAQRLLWFQDKWRRHPDWYKKAERSMKTIFAQYSLREEDREREASPPTVRKTPGGRIDDDDEDLAGILTVDVTLLTGNKGGSKRHKRQSELQCYIDDVAKDLAEGRPELNCPLQWWQTIGSARYPTVYKIALDFLSIPATSCECERCFSAAKRTITVDRNKLSPATIEALQLQKNWLRNRAVQSHLIELSDHIKQVGRAGNRLSDN